MDAIIRKAQPADAEQLLAYVQQLAEEPGIDIPVAPGEFNLSVEEEREVLGEFAQADNSVFLVAELDGQIIGALTCRGGKRKATRHAVILGMSVAKDWREKGIGSLLLAAAIDWARATGIVKRIELVVYQRNQRAIRLYQKYGFEVEGWRRRTIFQDGKYLDDYEMALLL